MGDDRWATFDCYGTLIDWNGGISTALGQVFGADANVPELVRRYHELEPAIESERYRRYREVLDLCLAGLALGQGRVLGDGETTALSESRTPTQIVDDIRRAENSEAPDAKKLRVSEYTDVTSKIAGDARLIQLKSGVYIGLDPDAGVRAYTRKGKLLKWWYGYFLVQGVDHFTGLPLAAHGFAADQNEHTHCSTVVEKTIATLGRVPDFVTTDKAYYVEECFKWSVTRGITLVAPYRAYSKGAAHAQATIHCDEHGIPHCRGCGEGTDQVTFFVEPAKGRNGEPRPLLRYRCAAPQEADCVGVQEKSCLADPMRLLPVWRTHPAYSEARTRHQALERNHYEARSRANGKARHFETAPNRSACAGRSCASTSTRSSPG